jgi:hypothetical protein
MDKVTEKWGAINCVVNCAGKLQTKYLHSEFLFASKSSQLDNILFYYYELLLFILFLFFWNVYVRIGIAPPMRTLSKKGVAHDLKQFM